MKTVTCFISQSDKRVFNVEVDSKGVGQECLEKICKILGIVEEEQDYFGLQFTGHKCELLWLNMRNKLSKQIPGSPPYQLNFRVKYFVEPHMLLHDETRYQFYLDTRRHLIDGIWDSGGLTDNTRATLISLMSQADFGDFNIASSPCKYACFWPDNRDCEIPASVLRLVASRHRDIRGQPVARMQYSVLRTASQELPMFGVFFYECKNCYDERLLLGIGPDTIFECNAKDREVRHQYRFCQVQKVQVSGRIFFLTVINADASHTEFGYRMVTRAAANALYRCVTEMHAFYRCHTVHEEVTSQTNRDFRTTLVSLFSVDHESSDHKEYVFDVRKTSREVYDTARRRLYSCSSEVSGSSSPEDPSHIDEVLSDDDSAASIDSSTSSQPSPLEQASLCRVCMDKTIARVFIPCGHLVCCEACAELVNACVVCRQEIAERQRIYLPWSTADSFDDDSTFFSSSSTLVPQLGADDVAKDVSLCVT